MLTIAMVLEAPQQIIMVEFSVVITFSTTTASVWQMAPDLTRRLLTI